MSKQTNTSDSLTVIIPLDYPFKNGMGETISEITLRRPKLSELRAMQAKKSDEEREIYLITLLSGMVIEDLDEMDALCDYKKLQEAITEMGKPLA